MKNRVLDISSEPAKLSLSLGRIRISRVDSPDVEIPIEDLSAVICAHPQIRLTQGLLAGLAEALVPLVVSNSKFQPVGMMLPLAGHSSRGPIFQRQASLSIPAAKRLWRDLVQAKIRAQGECLRRVRGSTYGLEKRAERVLVSNAAASEATASRYYWVLLFRDKSYLRSKEADCRNGLLDYGYAVVRAITARAICGAGLHPGLGVHHHNRYDLFPLANDLMEPFRPLVDEWVAHWTDENRDGLVLDAKSKSSLLSWLTGRFVGDGESRTLFDWVERTAEQLARCIEGKRKGLAIPHLAGGDTV
jgi:CRISP-associated protein Cas1